MLLAPIFRRGPKPMCSDEVFVTVYMEKFLDGDTQWSVAKQLGYSSEQAVYLRACKLRARGALLPYFSMKWAFGARNLNAIIFGKYRTK